MHPELIRALAKGRHEDLLNAYPSRGQPRVRRNEHGSLFSRSRHRVGALLIHAGARLIGDGRAVRELELAPGAQRAR